MVLYLSSFKFIKVSEHEVVVVCQSVGSREQQLEEAESPENKEYYECTIQS